MSVALLPLIRRMFCPVSVSQTYISPAESRHPQFWHHASNTEWREQMKEKGKALVLILFLCPSSPVSSHRNNLRGQETPPGKASILWNVLGQHFMITEQQICELGLSEPRPGEGEEREGPSYDKGAMLLLQVIQKCRNG
ncbi:hypothetical protein F7725_020837 [Dissostichus mawsoni]|uniref:Uncharacterized protein n=1 Tax=Dissostichus mawsoni TaxID=36200 RepID=A0A7J5YGA6_DISMA|nr:hypothetical protein F7725_020837 [Dissostichus mawsoni]